MGNEGGDSAEERLTAASETFARDLTNLWRERGGHSGRILEGKAKKNTDADTPMFSRQSATDWTTGKRPPSTQGLTVALVRAITNEPADGPTVVAWKARRRELDELQERVDDERAAREQGAGNRKTGEDLLLEEDLLLGEEQVLGQGQEKLGEQPGAHQRLSWMRLGWSLLGGLALAAVVVLGVLVAVIFLINHGNSGSSSGQLATYDPAYMEEVNTVAVSPDGRLVAAGGGQSAGEVMVWARNAASSLSPLSRTSEAADGPVNALSFSPDGRILAIGGQDGTFQLWQVSPTSAPLSLGPPVSAKVGQVNAVSFSPDGRILAVGGQAGIQLWTVVDPRAPVVRGPLLSAVGQDVQAAAFDPVSPGGIALLAAGTTDGRLLVWSVGAGAPTPMPTPTTADDDSTLAGINTLAFSPDGRQLVAGSSGAMLSSSNDSTVSEGLLLFEVTDPQHIHEAEGERNITTSVDNLAVLPAQNSIAVVGGGTEVVLYGSGNLQYYQCLNAPGSSPLEAIASVPGTNEIVTGAADGSIAVWNGGAANNDSC